MDGEEDVGHHSCEHNEPKPDVKRHHKVDYGDSNVHEGGCDAEQQVAEEVVDTLRAAVHDPQHLACLAAEVPAQRERVQVVQHVHLQPPAGVLLHADPQEAAQVVSQAHGADRATLQEAQQHVDEDGAEGQCEPGLGHQDVQLLVHAVHRSVAAQSVHNLLVVERDENVDDPHGHQDDEADCYPQLQQRVPAGPHVGEQQLGLAPQVGEGGGGPPLHEAALPALALLQVVLCGLHWLSVHQ